MSDEAQRVARIVAANTGGKQSESIDEAHVRTIACGPGGMAATDFRPALVEALEQGWVEKTDAGEFRSTVGWHDLHRESR